MPKQRSLDEAPGISVESILKQIAVGVSNVAADREELSLAEQWKIDLMTGAKTRLDLIRFLDNAPGRPVEGEAMDPDIPVPWYHPGTKQWAAHACEGVRTKVVAGGWRAGKSKWLAAELLPYMFKDHARVWIVGPDYSLATEEFDYIREWLHWMGAKIRVSDPQDGSKQLWTSWGAHLETKPAIKEKLEAAALNAAGVAEAGAISKSIIDQLRSRVFQRRGPLLVSGRMEADYLWYIQAVERYQTPQDGWASFSIPSWENTGMFPGGRQDSEILHMERELPEEEFRRKVCAEVVKAREIVFHEFDQGKHVMPIEWYEPADAIADALVAAYSHAPRGILAPAKPTVEPLTGRVTKWKLPSTVPITLAIDPGYDHAYAVLALARIENQVFVVDELYLQGTVAEDVIYECKQKEWWPRVTAVAPGPAYSVIDVAANQHQGMKSHHEVWREMAKLYLRTQMVPIPDGIMRLRTFLETPGSKEPRIWIDPKCEGLIDEFNKYKYRLQRENRPVREEPIDSNNHSIKALEYWLVVNFGFVDKEPRINKVHRYIDRRPEQDMEGIWHKDFGWSGF